MKALHQFAILLAFTLVMGATEAKEVKVSNDADKPEILTASSAFEFFNSLNGEWDAKTVTVPVGTKKEEGVEETSEITYKSIANGTTVMGTYYKGSPMQMLDMIHQDGPEVLRLTHYSAIGNQPRMKFVKSDKPGIIQFKFDGGSNMDVKKDGHVHEAKLRILDKDNFEVETDLWNGGKHSMTTYFSISRKKE